MKDLIKQFNRKEIIFVSLVLLIAIILKLSNAFLETHAYYNDEITLPLFNTKVGNFSGKGDTTPLDRNTDINVMYYVQDITNPKNYSIMTAPPVEVKGFIVDDKKSNCIPKDASYEMTSGNVFSVKEDGEVTIKVTQDNAKQVVCRIYYSYKDPLNEGIVLFAMQQDDNGNVIHNNKKYSIVADIPTTYTYSDYDCTNKGASTYISYDVTNGFKYKTTEPNICYAYFNK